MSKNVYFSYPSRPDVSVLQGLSVSVTPGETLALVGSSGGGKSTLILLIERFYSPTAGILTVDGLDITSINRKWLRSQIGYVAQEPVLFGTSIADNIRYGALFREVSDDEIVEVAKSCYIHDFIQSLPQVHVRFAGNMFRDILNTCVIKCVFHPIGLQYKCWCGWITSQWRSEAENCYCPGSDKESQNPAAG